MITAGGDQEQAVVLRLGTKEFETYSRSLDKRSLGYRFVKRLFDIVFSVFVNKSMTIASISPMRYSKATSRTSLKIN